MQSKATAWPTGRLRLQHTDAEPKEMRQIFVQTMEFSPLFQRMNRALASREISAFTAFRGRAQMRDQHLEDDQRDAVGETSQEEDDERMQ